MSEEEKTLRRQSIERAIKRAWDYQTALAEESDRAAAILAAANFEDRLRAAIMTRFVTLDSRDEDGIFKPYGPLSTFKAKVDIAFALGLYDCKTRKGLHTVGEIRNRFAHSSEPMKFDHEKVAAKCRKLDTKAVQDSDDLRERYLTYLREIGKLLLQWGSHEA